DVTVPDVLLAGDGAPSGANVFDPLAGPSGSSSSSRLAANLFTGVPFTGQVNLLTTGSFDSPRQLFTADNFSRSIAYFSLTALASSRALARGAEEFVPPVYPGRWLRPQRTFSSIVEGQPLRPERTEHLALEAERDFGGSTVSLRAFRQRVNDQLVTMFDPGV